MKTFTRGKNQEVCRESIVRKPLQEARILKNTEKHKTNLYRKQESVKKRRETRENSHTRIHITRKAFEGASKSIYIIYIPKTYQCIYFAHWFGKTKEKSLVCVLNNET